VQLSVSQVVALDRRDPANKEFHMNKTRLGLVAAAALALPIAAPVAALADTQNTVETTIGDEAGFEQGGAHVGQGAAELVEHAVSGLGTYAINLPSELASTFGTGSTTFSSEEVTETGDNIG
jgi:hypothetical protein